MVDSVITSAFTPVTAGIAKGLPATGGSSGIIIFIAFLLGIAIIGVVGGFVYYYFWSKKQWNITTRVHYENPTIDGISLGGAVPTKRIRFKSGIVAYMYKSPIQGYTISPELLTWTRPREHDVIVTQDKKLFSLIGINSIDVQRKKLNVDIAYPDIEMDRQDLQKHIDSKKFDDPNERFKIIAKVALYIFIMVTVIILMVLGSKTYIDNKNIDASRDSMNLQVTQGQIKVMESLNTFVAILSRVMPESFKNIDNQNLINNGTLVATP
jgi:flagellar basal body-associated protein FliL